MRLLIFLVIVLCFPITLSCGEHDPVMEFISNQPNIAIDMSATPRSQFKDNWELKRKNFKPGSRRNK